MIPLSHLAGKSVAVMGLGRSGLVAAQALCASSARVSAWDDDPTRRATAEAAGIPVSDFADYDWQHSVGLLLSPGIPHLHPEPHPVAAAARTAGATIFGDVELLARACPRAAYVGVTGTNGKSTTTALIGHLLTVLGHDVEVGGNLGAPVLGFRPLNAKGVYVLELSSYQLELTDSLACRIAVLLNITPDHLDRHGGLEGYVAAKRRLFRFSRRGGQQIALIGVDDRHGQALAEDLAGSHHHRVVPIAMGRAVAGGLYVLDGRLIDHTGGRAQEVMDVRSLPTLKGVHNQQNAAAAYGVVRAFGYQPQAIAEALGSFPGLAHRQELVAVREGIAFVNDSKATNMEAAARALASFERIYWIAGGRPKSGGMSIDEVALVAVRRAFLIGEATEELAAAVAGRVPLTRSGDLATALSQAIEAARAEGGGVVLLSPACASFDQFNNFEHRGDVFRDLVMRLPETPPLSKEALG